MILISLKLLYIQVMENEAGFKPGDVIKLKSGGPAMTVTPNSTATEVEAEWFVDRTEIRKHQFSNSVVERIESAPNVDFSQPQPQSAS